MGIRTECVLLAQLFGNKLSTVLELENDSCVSIRIDDLEFSRIPDETIFYDWYANSNGSVEGLELHIDRSDFAYQAILRHQAEWCLSHSFLRIPISQTCDGTELGLEAFGDISMFENEDVGFAIMVPLESWLTKPQADSIRKAISPIVNRLEFGYSGSSKTL